MKLDYKFFGMLAFVTGVIAIIAAVVCGIAGAWDVAGMGQSFGGTAGILVLFGLVSGIVGACVRWMD